MTGSKLDLALATFSFAIQGCLNEKTSNNLFEQCRMVHFIETLKKNVSPEIEKGRIKLAQEFRKKLAAKNTQAYSEYFYVDDRDYPAALDRLISDLKDENFLFDEDNDDHNHFIITQDPELCNLINDFIAMNFNFGLELELKKAEQPLQQNNGYVATSVETVKNAGKTATYYASYFDPRAYSYSLTLWGASIAKEERLQFCETNSSVEGASNDTKKPYPPM